MTRTLVWWTLRRLEQQNIVRFLKIVLKKKNFAKENALHQLTAKLRRSAWAFLLAVHMGMIGIDNLPRTTGSTMDASIILPPTRPIGLEEELVPKSG